MVKLFDIKDTLANKISYYHLLFFMASLPFDLFYNHLILASYCIHTLIQLERKKIKPFFTIRALSLSSVFLVTVASTVYSANKPQAFNEWGKQATIAIFPLLFWLNPFDLGKYRQQLLIGFATVCTATIIYLYTDTFVTIGHYHLPYSTIVSSAFTNHNFSEPIGMHATFFSMQLIVALAAVILSLAREKNIYSKLFYLFCALVLTVGILQLSSKSAFAILVLLINVGVPWFLLRGRARVKFILASLLLTFIVAGGILSSSAYRERFVTELQVDMAKPTTGETYDGRLARWEASVDLIKKKPIAGYGAGTEIGLLQQRFYERKMYDSYLNRLNGHSEYLSITLKSGVIGLLIYLVTLAFGFRMSVRRRDLPFLAFMVTIAIISFSENLLDVDKGTCFYAFFFSFFVFSAQDDPKKNVTEMPLSKIETPPVDELVGILLYS